MILAGFPEGRIRGAYGHREWYPDGPFGFAEFRACRAEEAQCDVENETAFGDVVVGGSAWLYDGLGEYGDGVEQRTYKVKIRERCGLVSGTGVAALGSIEVFRFDCAA